MSLSGAGHFLMIELWNGDECVHAGILEPGQDFAGLFRDAPIIVSGFVLTRLTREQVDALAEGQVFGPPRVVTAPP